MPPEGALIPAPRSMTFGPDGVLYVLDNAGRVLVFDQSGEEIKRWFMPEYDVGKAEGICVLKDGRIAVADTHYHRVVFFDADGQYLSKHGSYGREAGQFIYPVAITKDDDDSYYVCEYGGHDRIQKFNSQGEWQWEAGSFGTEPGQFSRPSGIVWHDSKLYVADAINNQIQVFADDGRFVAILGASDAGPGLQYPYDLSLSPNEELFVVEYGANRVSRLDLNGQVLGRFGTTGTSEGQFSTPWGIAVDKSGRVVVADTGNRRIVELKL